MVLSGDIWIIDVFTIRPHDRLDKIYGALRIDQGELKTRSQRNELIVYRDVTKYSGKHEPNKSVR